MNSYSFSHIKGKLKTEEIETLLREKWVLLIKYQSTRDFNRIQKDILGYNRLVESYESLHYNGVHFSDIKIRNLKKHTTEYKNYTFIIKANNHHVNVQVESPPGCYTIFMDAKFSKDNLLLHHTLTHNFQPIYQIAKDKKQKKEVLEYILGVYSKKRPANPYLIFYVDWDKKSNKLTSRYTQIYKNMVVGFCNCYRSFIPNDFGHDLSNFFIDIKYNKKLYEESGVTTNYLSLLTGISYHTLIKWGDELPMENISFRNFVKISAVLNGPTTFYDKFMDPKIVTKYNPKYRNLTLKEIRTLTNTSQAVFALILDTSRKHYLEIEKNPALLGDRPVQTIYHLALFCKCRVKQLFPIQLIQRYQTEAQACASNFLRTNPVKGNSSIRKIIKTYIQQTD